MGKRSRAERVRRGGVFVGSAVLHLLVFLVAFSGEAGDPISAGDAGGGPQGPVIAVSLVRLNAPVPSEGGEPAEMAALRIKVRELDAREGVYLRSAETENRFPALADRLTQAERPKAVTGRVSEIEQAQPEGSLAPDPENQARVLSRSAATGLNTEGEMGTSASTGALWGAIAPCWRRLAFKGQVAVTLEVELDALGRLRRPPVVVRDPAAIVGEVRLRSEANALAALNRCLGAGAAVVGATRRRIEFPAGS